MEADLAGAEVLLLEALQLRRETLGDKHPDTIHSISNTGMLLKDKRDFVGAEELLLEAVAAMRESTDEAASSAQGQGSSSSSSSSSSLLICQSNLGTLYKDKGDLVKAEEMLRETLNEMRKSLGDRHPATLSALVQLGLVLLEKRELIGAEELLTEALTANREIFVSGHPQLLASITWLAGLHETKGDIAAALPLHQEVLSGFSAANHPMTHRCASHVAALLRQQGREAEAEAVLSEYGVSLAAPAVAPPPQPVTHAPSSEEPQGGAWRRSHSGKGCGGAERFERHGGRAGACDVRYVMFYEFSRKKRRHNKPHFTSRTLHVQNTVHARRFRRSLARPLAVCHSYTRLKPTKMSPHGTLKTSCPMGHLNRARASTLRARRRPRAAPRSPRTRPAAARPRWAARSSTRARRSSSS